MQTPLPKGVTTLCPSYKNLSSCPKPKDIKTTCYKSLVGPQLEYRATVWDPNTKSNINKPEAVQRRAARFCHSNYQHTSSASATIEDWSWEQLEAQRQQLKAAMLHRIINHLVDIQATSLFIPAGTITRGHANRFLAPFGSVNAFKYSFYPSSIRLEQPASRGHLSTVA